MESIARSTRSESGLVSVGVPVKNGAPQLCRALESVCGQTYKNLEILISDNASSDRTRQIGESYARQDPRVRYHRISGTREEKFATLEAIKTIEDIYKSMGRPVPQ